MAGGVRQRPIPQKFGDESTRQLSLFRSDDWRCSHMPPSRLPGTETRNQQVRWPRPAMLSNRLGGAEDAQGVIKKGRSSLSGNTNHLTYATVELLHHFFMSRATGEVAPG